MKIRRTNITEKILASRNQRISEPALQEMIGDIFAQQALRDEEILEKVQMGAEEDSNDFYIDLLETRRIFHISDIEKICVHYRLRFLSSSFFKAELPYEAIIKIKELEKKHHTSLKGFKIMAPARLFKLANADDPLLFAPIGNQYYYLIHSWGKDLHPFRKIIMWPLRQLENFLATLFLLSLIFTLFVPDGMFGHNQSTSEFFIIFFFMFKWIISLAIFYGFKFGKNFSSAIWDSKYFNA